METRICTNIHLNPDCKVRVGSADDLSWVTVDGAFTLFANNFERPEPDLDVLEAFLARGLVAIHEHRQQRLFTDQSQREGANVQPA